MRRFVPLFLILLFTVSAAPLKEQSITAECDDGWCHWSVPESPPTHYFWGGRAWSGAVAKYIWSGGSPCWNNGLTAKQTRDWGLPLYLSYDDYCEAYTGIMSGSIELRLHN